MPTGYTNTLIDKGQTFPQFALTCARAFGAFVEMRDDPLDAPIPNSFKPSTYHMDSLKKARAKLARLERMTQTGRIAYGIKQRERSLATYRRGAKRADKQNLVLTRMEQKVATWTPPTPDHDGIKAFMLQQLDVSKNKGDYYTSAIDQISQITPSQHWMQDVKDEKRSIKIHTEEVQEEKERAERNTRWIQDLRKSLTPQ